MGVLRRESGPQKVSRGGNQDLENKRGLENKRHPDEGVKLKKRLLRRESRPREPERLKRGREVPPR